MQKKDEKILKVPHFKTAKDFSVWVDSLAPEEIKSWSAKDWNKMYENLFHYLIYSKEMHIAYIETIEEYIANKEIPEKTTTRDFSDDENLYLRTRVFLDNIENRKALGYLYMNYRPEKKQISTIIKYAKQAGKEVAKKSNFDLVKMVYSENIYAENNPQYLSRIQNKSQNELTKASEIINMVVYSQTKFFKELKKRKLPPRILEAIIEFFPDKDGDIRKGNTANTTKRPIIKIKNHGDEKSLETLFHEFSHAHLQRIKQINSEEFAFLKKLRPIYELDEDYYKLLEYNDKLYINYEENTLRFLVENDREKICKEKGSIEYQKIYNKADRCDYKSYKHQPIEWFAFLYGMIAERYFRQESKQYSERSIFEAIGSLNYVNYNLTMPNNVELGKDKKIKFTWKKLDIEGCTSNLEALKFLETILNCKDSPLQNIVETGLETNKDIYLKFPNTKNVKEKWYDWADIAIKPVTDIIDLISPTESVNIGDMNAKEETIIVYDKTPFNGAQINQYLEDYISIETISKLNIKDTKEGISILIPSSKSSEYKEFMSFLKSNSAPLFTTMENNKKYSSQDITKKKEALKPLLLDDKTR